MNRQNCFLIFLTAFFVILTLAGAVGEGRSLIEPESGSLMKIWVADWGVAGNKNGKKVPVYSAPFDDAWRGANGKAAVSTKEAYRFLGIAQNGEWTWIEYEVNAKNRRVGWVRTDQLPQRDEYECIPVDGALLRITRNTFVTDDPRGGKRKIKTLAAGDEVIGLGSVNTVFGDEYIYVETEIDGKPAWGFLPAGVAEKIPSYTIVDGAVIYREGISIIGDNYLEIGVLDEEGEAVTRKFGPGELKGEGLYVIDTYDDEESLYGEDEDNGYGGAGMDHGYDGDGSGAVWVDRVIYPSTLRILGSEAITYGIWNEIRMPESLEQCDDFALYQARVKKLVFPKNYQGPDFRAADCSIGFFEVEEGNPLYKSVDGVLYSADGKTLLRYPGGRKEEHFDVPAGVETIGNNAFGDSDSAIPLKTISLPMGLKRIEAYAFSGCGRLLSLTIPLTVTELDPTAFAYCVSLERLSMPDALWQAFEIGYAYLGDFTHYNGDNGETMPVPKDDY